MERLLLLYSTTCISVARLLNICQTTARKKMLSHSQGIFFKYELPWCCCFSTDSSHQCKFLLSGVLQIHQGLTTLKPTVRAGDYALQWPGSMCKQCTKKYLFYLSGRSRIRLKFSTRGPALWTQYLKSGIFIFILLSLFFFKGFI